MPTAKRPRRGSLQFWPRRRAAKVLPSANWKTLANHKENGLLGFITYKAGMTTALVKDNSAKTQTTKKQVATPATVLEAPNMKIFAVRFYKDGQVTRDIVVSNDKELKRLVKVPKTKGSLDKAPEGYDDIRIIAYSLVKQTAVKKTPDMIEIAIIADDKLAYVKERADKELTIDDLAKSHTYDARGLTTGKGMAGPVKRFGITLRVSKAEKGQRKVGSIGPWHPAHVTFRVPMAGQLGWFSRIIYNLLPLSISKISENDINPKSGFPNYGRVKGSYVILKGSVMGPCKRQILVTPSYRPSKKMDRMKLELIEVRN